MPQRFTRNIGGRELVIEHGKVAMQADGSIMLQYGETVILATAVMSPLPRDIDFFPLTVDYEERLYAAGKIPGSFFRREGRPTSEAILTGRLTDRPLRPLFPKGFRNDVQIIVTVLSADQENDPDVLAVVGASTAVSISQVPFAGPVSAVRVGYLDGEYVLNPTFAQRDESALDLVVAATRNAVMMVEAGANIVPEAVVLGGIEFGFQGCQDLIDLQDEIVRAVGKQKYVFEPAVIPAEAQAAVREWASDKLAELIPTSEKGERDATVAVRRAQLVEALGDRFDQAVLLAVLDAEIKQTVRTRVFEGRRPDGRGPSEIRPISVEVGLVPRTHGSGLFARGATQVLTLTTLGSTSEEQRLDTISPESKKRYMHHYNFPPFSVGEARRIGSPGRREIGHGALAERALEPVIPPVEEFPYTLRLVSEVLSSNGSTSMASVCGSTLSLMDAGVPIKAPVAGVAMGLMMGEDGKYTVLTDIAGMEDALGDMDFKVAGTAEGITALQMDIKVKGITPAIMGEALEQAREARLFILGRMLETIAVPHEELSPYAPRMYKIQIPTEKIGAVIGPGGKTIRAIIEETKATIDVHDDGSVYVGSPSAEGAQKAIQMIQNLTKEIEVGEIYTGKVTRLMNFGAFVEILPGREGMVHISELADYRVASVEDAVKVGDEVMVMVIEIDQMGRVNLSRRAVLEGTAPPARPAGERPPGGPRRSGPGGGFGGSRGDGRPRGGGGPRPMGGGPRRG